LTPKGDLAGGAGSNSEGVGASWVKDYYNDFMEADVGVKKKEIMSKCRGGIYNKTSSGRTKTT